MALATTQWRPHPDYGDAIEAEINVLAKAVEHSSSLTSRFATRWLAIQLLEGDETLLAHAQEGERDLLWCALADSKRRLATVYGEDTDIAIAGRRYGFVRELVQEVVSAPATATTRSDRLDRILTHRWLGIPILLAVMFLVFNLVQTIAAPYLDGIDTLVNGPISQESATSLAAVGAPEWLSSLIAGGVIRGVGGVLVFLPGLMAMFLALAFLEACGYMARAAFVMDRAMSLVGLQGQSFVPMILGFGCNVPAIYATRTIENRSARVLTGLLIPFMSCSARLPVYVIFGLAFFGERAGVMIWGLYVLGVVVAALVGVVLSRTVFRRATPGTFVLEMPPYRWPSARELWQYTGRQTAAFLRKAGTFILAVSVVFWLLMHLPWGVQEPRASVFGRVAQAIAPVFEPAGFGNWESSGALLTGVLAKEAVVASLSQLYVGQAEDGGLPAALRNSMSPLAAVAFVTFVLLYVPCVATIGVQIQEFGWRWAGLSAAIMLVVPWLAAVMIYQTGRLLGLA